MICDDDVLTYADAASRSAALAKGLLASGAGRCTHVGLLHPNGASFVVGWLAAARIGAVTVPLSTFSTSAELRTLLRMADIEMLLATTSFRGRDYVEALREAMRDQSSPPALRRTVFDEAYLVAAGAGIDDEMLAAAEGAVSPADRMVIVHTSGSTSDPKGVIHEHGPLIRHLDNLNQLRRYTEGEVLFSNSPFFWIGGFA
ncbi:MAG TPA: AMP-binding protein, partial [Acidimicrobiia bacterium]|nr:AMP-binding protein [Acidimicrobiia bacterium]